MSSASKSQLPADARKTVVHETFQGFVTDMIATRLAVGTGAQAFLVEQNPHWVTPSHFHLEQQFQVVVAGEGSIGRHAAKPFMVHYAAPETGYGPITAGPDGIAYLTLRAMADTGAWYLHKPGSRERMRPGLKREQAHASPGVEDGAAREVLIAPRSDGLAAHLVHLSDGAPMELPAGAPDGGRFYVFTRGTARAGDASLEALGVMFAAADEAPTIIAGPEGADVLVLQFPRADASRPHS